MFKSIFNEGQPQSISDVLKSKDRRVALQAAIFDKHPKATLLDVKLNIPGPIKNNTALARLFTKGCWDLEQVLKAKKLKYQLLTSWNNPSGCEKFYLVNQDGLSVKNAAIKFEDTTKLGRLFDADVLVKGQAAALSRHTLGFSVRRCFLCNRPAKECSRSRRHSIDELQNYISQIYNQEFN